MVVYYHVTPTENVPSILQRGLEPRCDERSQALNEKPGVFLFRSRAAVDDALLNWLGDAFDDTPLTLLRVYISDNEAVEMTLDWEAVTRTAIPWTHIQIEVAEI